MATQALISWKAPEHLHLTKNPDWYWGVGIVSLTITVVCFIFGQIIPGIFVIVATSALVLHAANPPKEEIYEINDRGIVIGDTLYPFLTLDSFSIPHDHFPPKLLLKSHKTFMPLMVIYIEEADPEEVREILLKYISETEHHESIFKHLLERLGF
ncbi:MAG: hypothetical protein WCV79_00675 [Candidatus Paceibacterota bacterium]